LRAASIQLSDVDAIATTVKPGMDISVSHESYDKFKLWGKLSGKENCILGEHRETEARQEHRVL
jgi:hypothetical protein